MEVKRISLKVSPDTYDWIQEEANKRALSMNAFIILMTEQYRTQNAALGFKDVLEFLQQAQAQEQQKPTD